MRTAFRFLALACACSAALALSATALATPRLIVSGGPSPGSAAATNVQITEDKSDASPLKISIYQPTGYTATLGQPAGTQIGTVHADLQALAISPDAIVQADGTILTDDPAKHTTDTCSPGVHAAIWLLHVTISGTTLDVVVYVDPTSGAEAALGAAKIVLCLPDPYIPQSAGGAAFGAKIINAKLTLNSGVITNPSSASTYLWRATITPWNPTTPAPDAAKTVEVQSIVELPPGQARVRTKVTKLTKTKSRVIVTAQITQFGTSVPFVGASVSIYANGKKIASGKTNAAGLLTKAVNITKTTKFQVKSTVAQQDVGCSNPLPATSVPGGCVGATIAAWSGSSPILSVKPKK